MGIHYQEVHLVMQPLSGSPTDPDERNLKYYMKRNAANETPVFFDCHAVVGWIIVGALNVRPAIGRKPRIT